MITSDVREPIVRTVPLAGGPLARALLDGSAASWMVAPPRSVAEWRDRIATVRSEFTKTDWLDRLRAALQPSGPALDRLERVARGGGIVITTGQQPGLFGGPIYTWSKALSALALADAVEEATGVPAAAVFWAATDDSDFLEASRTIVAVPGGVELLELPRPPDGVADRMMSAVPLGDVEAMLPVLARGAGAAVHVAILDLARRCYGRDATVGGAYVCLLRAVLEPLGIAVLDAAHPAVGEAMAPLMREALLRDDRLTAALESRDAEITARGFEPKVRAVPGLTLVFERRDGRRGRISKRAAADAARRDGTLGPNVLLRPVAERALLPTIAYAAGPGELAYFAQASAVAAALGVAAPLAVPRWSCTILEPHVLRILRRLGLTPESVRDPHAAEIELARSALSPQVAEALASFRRTIDVHVAELRRANGGEGGPLLAEAVIDGHARALQHRVDRLERRALAASKQRVGDLVHAVATARGALWPLGAPQERKLNLLPLLARHGPLLMERMRDHAREHARALVDGGRTLVASG